VLYKGAASVHAADTQAGSTVPSPGQQLAAAPALAAAAAAMQDGLRLLYQGLVVASSLALQLAAALQSGC
jgi:hypothetical protein